MKSLYKSSQVSHTCIITLQEFSDCADACVKDVSSALLDSFRGYDWNCKDEKCSCVSVSWTLDFIQITCPLPSQFSSELTWLHITLLIRDPSQHIRQLYDRGSLDNQNSGRFNRTNHNENGEGSIEGTTEKSDNYCAKLVGAEFVGNDFDKAEEFEAEVSRALRGGN